MAAFGALKRTRNPLVHTLPSALGQEVVGIWDVTQLLPYTELSVERHLRTWRDITPYNR